ncbi:MAG: hypothetical protein ACRDGR_01590, partial [bacterium]
PEVAVPRRAALAAVLFLLSPTSPAARGADAVPSGWTLSFSGTDPFVHEAPPVAVFTLFLHRVCGDPFSRAEFGVCTSDGLEPYILSPLNGFAGTFDGANVELVAPGGCHDGGPVLAASLIVLDFEVVGGSVCFCPSSAGVLGEYDCGGGETPAPFDRVGATTDGSAPCTWFEFGNELCSPGATPVPEPDVAAPWSRVKARYRDAAGP